MQCSKCFTGHDVNLPSAHHTHNSPFPLLQLKRCKPATVVFASTDSFSRLLSISTQSSEACCCLCIFASLPAQITGKAELRPKTCILRLHLLILAEYAFLSYTAFPLLLRQLYSRSVDCHCNSLQVALHFHSACARCFCKALICLQLITDPEALAEKHL